MVNYLKASIVPYTLLTFLVIALSNGLSRNTDLGFLSKTKGFSFYYYYYLNYESIITNTLNL